MRRQCNEGSVLCTHYKRVLKVWGFEEVDRQAAEIIPIGLARKKEILRIARKAEAALFKSRHALVEHLTNCLVCSRHIAMS